MKARELKVSHTFDCKNCTWAEDGGPCSTHCAYEDIVPQIGETEFKLLNVSQLLLCKPEVKRGRENNFTIYGRHR